MQLEDGSIRQHVCHIHMKSLRTRQITLCKRRTARTGRVKLSLSNADMPSSIGYGQQALAKSCALHGENLCEGPFAKTPRVHSN